MVNEEKNACHVAIIEWPKQPRQLMMMIDYRSNHCIGIQNMKFFLLIFFLSILSLSLFVCVLTLNIVIMCDRILKKKILIFLFQFFSLWFSLYWKWILSRKKINQKIKKNSGNCRCCCCCFFSWWKLRNSGWINFISTHTYISL